LATYLAISCMHIPRRYDSAFCSFWNLSASSFSSRGNPVVLGTTTPFNLCMNCRVPNHHQLSPLATQERKGRFREHTLIKALLGRLSSGLSCNLTILPNSLLEKITKVVSIGTLLAPSGTRGILKSKMNFMGTRISSASSFVPFPSVVEESEQEVTWYVSIVEELQIVGMFRSWPANSLVPISLRDPLRVFWRLGIVERKKDEEDRW